MRNDDSSPDSKPSKEELDEILREFDEDGGLLMEFPEFCTMMLF